MVKHTKPHNITTPFEKSLFCPVFIHFLGEWVSCPSLKFTLSIVFVIIKKIPPPCFCLQHSIKFEFGLAAYADGGFGDLIFNAAIDLTIFGKRLYLAAAFDLRDPVGSLKLGADKATEWYKDRMNRKNPTSTSENYYDNANPNADFELSGQCYVE